MAVTIVATTRMKPERLVDEAATSDERTYAVFTHLSLLAHLLTGGLGIVVAIVMWLVKKDSSPFIDDHGREAINFQITLIIYLIACAFLVMLCGIGVVIMPFVYVLAIVGMIMAVKAANRGEYFRYPATIRFLR
jgi:uncharacterized protein